MELRIFTEPQQGASYDTLLAVAKATEDLGFDGFFRSDHYMAMAMGSADGLPGPTDAWVTLAGLARETRRIRLGTLVSPATFRLPGALAIQVAQVDQMSGGRAELGLGTGWFEAEHTAYGIPFPQNRFGPFEEQLAIITGLWNTPIGETYSFHGEHYTLEGAPALPKPVQTPHPPIIIGGAGSKRTPRLAAQYADEFNVPFHAVKDFKKAIDRVKKACEAQGRDPSSIVYSAAVNVDIRANSADKVVDELSQFKAAGAQRLYLQLLDNADVEQVSVIAGEVKPHL